MRYRLLVTLAGVAALSALDIIGTAVAVSSGEAYVLYGNNATDR